MEIKKKKKKNNCKKPKKKKNKKKVHEEIEVGEVLVRDKITKEEFYLYDGYFESFVTYDMLASGFVTIDDNLEIVSEESEEDDMLF